MNCPVCNNKRGNGRYSQSNIGLTQVYRCAKYGAVFGSCYLGDSYTIVKPSWHRGEDDPSQWFYFDLETVGSRGVERRHGWAHKDTHQIVQVG